MLQKVGGTRREFWHDMEVSMATTLWVAATRDITDTHQQGREKWGKDLQNSTSNIIDTLELALQASMSPCKGPRGGGGGG